MRATLILFLSIFGHKNGVLKSPALFQGKELQVIMVSAPATPFVTHLNDLYSLYCICSNKRRSAYLIFRASSVVLI